ICSRKKRARWAASRSNAPRSTKSSTEKRRPMERGQSHPLPSPQITTLAGVVSRSHGWGLDGESFNVLRALARFYGEPWFALGDRDLATHLYRTERIHQGVSLSRITAEIAGAFGIKSRIIPMSDDRVRTFVKLRGRRAIPFQEYFVRGRARGTVAKIELRGIGRARPNPTVLRAIRKSAAVILAPSNPFVSL